MLLLPVSLFYTDEALKKEDPEAAPAPVATYSPRTQSPDRERRSVSPSPSPSKVASHAKEQETAPTPDVTKPAVERLPEPEPTREAEEATPLDAIPPPEKQVEQAFGLSTLEPEIFPPTPVDAEGQRKLEEQLAEVPPEPAAEETELVAEELGAYHRDGLQLIDDSITDVCALRSSLPNRSEQGGGGCPCRGSRRDPRRARGGGQED